MTARRIVRRTKIIATIGPASSSKEMIEKMILSGVNLFRLNLSHGTTNEHSEALSMIRAMSADLNKAVGVIADLQGPKIRTGLLKENSVELKGGDKITITTDEIKGDAEIISTTYTDLPEDVSSEDKILIDDGLIELKVLKVTGNLIECEVIYGGTLHDHKGMNMPGVALSAPALSEKDIEDLDFAVRAGVDYIALSFVQSAADVIHLKELIKEKGARIPVISKIETLKATEELDEIVKVSDAVMIARGDLGVELGPEKVPVLQKKIVTMATHAAKPVITATQMLESMIGNPRPTRAEASDVANAVFDGTDAVMLSGETAVGKYPIKAVETMVKIILEAEAVTINKRKFLRRSTEEESTFTEAVTFAAFAAAGEVNAKAITVFSQTGESAIKLARLRPITPVVAFSTTKETQRRLTLVWGIEPYCIEYGSQTDEMICRGEAALIKFGLADWEDKIIIVAGTIVGMRGATNMMKIDWIGSGECRRFLD